MENQRLFILIAIAALGLYLFTEWTTQSTKRLQEIADRKVKPNPEIPGAKTPAKLTTSATPEKPSSKADSKSGTGLEGIPKIEASNVTTATHVKPKTGQRVKVITDVFNIEIDTVGADIKILDLTQHFQDIKKRKYFRIINDDASFTQSVQGNLVARQLFPESGFQTTEGSIHEKMAPTNDSIYTTTAMEYKLGDKQELIVSFVWNSALGTQVTKSYLFKKGSYRIDVKFTFANNSDKDWNGRPYYQFKRLGEATSSFNAFLPIYEGSAIFSNFENYTKYTYDDIKKFTAARTIDDKEHKEAWLAMLEQFFVSAWVPEKEKAQNFYFSYKPNVSFQAGFFPKTLEEIKAKSKAEYNSIFYAGPKVEKNLSAIGKGFERTVDYGYLQYISRFLFWVMDWIHSVIHNWGWSIIFLTVLIKLAFYKLSETSYRSMAKMRKVHPRLQQLKDRFGDNKQELHTAMMKLYKEEKINPFGGCLPILVQIPVFIALYYVLLESVELRHAPFMLWIQDLSTPDPYWILPLLMGVTMILQHKLNPAPLDPIQQKVMMAMPIVFTVFFFFFPSGLVLYWLVNNILSIAQQWVITKRISGNKPIFTSQ